MQHRIHCNFGLLHSGSTLLLGALLRQSLSFHASVSALLAWLFASPFVKLGGSSEFSIFTSDAQRQRILRGLFENYYAESPAQVIFDASRDWCARMPALSSTARVHN